jgi:hypothetical protein
MNLEQNEVQESVCDVFRYTGIFLGQLRKTIHNPQPQQSICDSIFKPRVCTEPRRPVFVSSFHESWPATRVVQSENTMPVAPWRRNSVLITLITVGGCFIVITLGWQQGFLSLTAWIFSERVACIQTPFKTPVSLRKPAQGSSNWVASDATKAELFALSARVPRFK